MKQKNDRHYTAAEAIDELITKGYTSDIETTHAVTGALPKAHSLNQSPDDFFVDEIFRCEDSMGEDHMVTYVFAVSSRKYKVKGIVANILRADDHKTPGFLHKLKQVFSELREYLHKD